MDFTSLCYTFPIRIHDIAVPDKWFGGFPFWGGVDLGHAPFCEDKGHLGPTWPNKNSKGGMGRAVISGARPTECFGTALL